MKVLKIEACSDEIVTTDDDFPLHRRSPDGLWAVMIDEWIPIERSAEIEAAYQAAKEIGHEGRRS